MSQKLTLDVGVRWDRFTATTFDDGLMFNWDPQSGNVIVPAAGLEKVSPYYPKTITVSAGQVVADPDARNFAPRIGVAYRLDEKTVIRGGYGIFNEFLGKYTRLNTGGPFAVTETNTITNGVPLFQMPNAFPSAGVSPSVPSQSVTGYPNQTENGYIHQFNATVERQIAISGFRLSYIGSRNVGLNYTMAVNKPQPSLIPFTSQPPALSPIQRRHLLPNGRKSQLRFHELRSPRRVGMVMFDAHWTWAHGMNNTLNVENPYSPLFWNRDFFAKPRVSTGFGNCLSARDGSS